MGKFNVFKKFEFFPYNIIRKRFQAILLNLLEKGLGKSQFSTLKNKIYKLADNGFYVHAKKTKQYFY